MKLKNLISIFCLAVFLATNAVLSVGMAKSTKNNFADIKVSDIMSLPVETSSPDISILEASGIVAEKRIKQLPILKEDELIGIITDGDLRRMLEQKGDLERLIAEDIMTANPQRIDEEELVVNALELMRENKITQLAVVKNGVYVGVVHMHDIVKEGII